MLNEKFCALKWRMQLHFSLFREQPYDSSPDTCWPFRSLMASNTRQELLIVILCSHRCRVNEAGAPDTIQFRQNKARVCVLISRRRRVLGLDRVVLILGSWSWSLVAVLPWS